MDKKNQNNKSLSAADLIAALKESRISAEELAAEINIMFDDYYAVDTVLKNKSLFANFLNGQKFKITVNEILNK